MECMLNNQATVIITHEMFNTCIVSPIISRYTFYTCFITEKKKNIVFIILGYVNIPLITTNKNFSFMENYCKM
jgi:hypothetical protein